MSFITDAAKYYAAEPHQDAAWEYLWESLDEYTQEEFTQLASRAGWRSLKHWVAGQQLFSVHLLQAAE